MSEQEKKAPFISGSGEMATLIRQHDWSGTGIGGPENWPLSLRTLVNMILCSRIPMMLFWGRDLITFYNDAYIPSLKNKSIHPSLFAQKGGVMLAAYWPNISEVMFTIMDSGQSIEFEDRQQPVYQGDNSRYDYWKYIFSPVTDDNGANGGVLATATAIMPQVITRIAIDESRRNLLPLSYETAVSFDLFGKIARTEAKFRSLIEEAPFATALYVGPDLIIQAANEEMIKLWGKTHAVIGMKLAEALPELEGQPFIPLLQEVRRSGVAYRTKEQSADLVVDGHLQRFWFNFTYKPLLDENKQVYAILNMAVDITAEFETREKLKGKETLLSGAIELAELATWSIDLKSGIVTYSKRLQEWIGLDHVQFDPTNNLPAVHEKDRARVQAAIIKAITPGGRGKMNETYTVINNITGRRRIIHSIGRTFFDDDGKPVSISGTAQDVTIQKELQLELEHLVQERTEELAAAIEELRATNEELADLNLELIRSNEELAQYAYVASHDLQEPLRKVRLFSDLLNDEGLSVSQRKSIIDKIQRGTERMSLLISDLLTFSRLLKSERVIAKVDLNEVVHDIINDFELVIEEKKAQVKVEGLPVIEAAKLQMNQLFYNLIGNALKFTSTSRTPEITISARQATPEEVEKYIEKPIPNTGYYTISVQDNGIGFDMSYLNQIWEVFRQLHGRDEYKGSGIGLAICRRVVENHHGGIGADATPGAGARFYIILPQFQSGNALAT